MKGFKILTLIVAAAVLCAPATALAKGGSRFSFSFSFFDCVPFFAPPPPPPVIEEHVYMPCPPPPPPVYVERRTVVREYNPYYDYPDRCEEIYIHRPHYHY